MKISLLQTNIHWNAPLQNINEAQALIDSAPDSDLYLLPEMWSTGFDTNPSPQTIQTKSLKWMMSTAKQKKCYIGGSQTVYGNESFFNRFFFVGPKGILSQYDKRHLFVLGTEQRNFTQGCERKIIDCCGFRILLQICYDLRFPVFSRNRKDYDMIVYVANWPNGRRFAWETLLKARAIENQCYVVGVNRVGEDPFTNYSGGSQIIGPLGETIVADNDSFSSQIITADVSMEHLQAYRKKFPVLDDADAFNLNL